MSATLAAVPGRALPGQAVPGRPGSAAGTVAAADGDSARAAESAHVTAAVADADLASGHGDQGSGAQVVDADLGSADAASSSAAESAQSAAVSSDAAAAAEASGLTAHPADADAARAAELAAGNGFARSDTDAAHGESSGFTFVSGADAGTAADGGQGAAFLAVAGADAGTGAARETAAWPHDGDSAALAVRVTAAWPRDGDSAAAADAGTAAGPWHDSDAASAADSANGTVEVYAYQPAFRWTGGRFALAWPVPGGEVVAWRGPRPDAAALRLAAVLAGTEVRHAHDSDGGTGRDDRAGTGLAAMLAVRAALRVKLEVRA